MILIIDIDNMISILLSTDPLPEVERALLHVGKPCVLHQAPLLAVVEQQEQSLAEFLITKIE